MERTMNDVEFEDITESEEDQRWARIIAFGRKCSNLVPHMKQIYNWDCGLTCAAMLLRRKLPNIGHKDLTERLESSSVWSIDLAYVLQSFGLDVSYWTTTTGIHPDYVALDFYNRVLDDDRERVERKFREARRHGVRVHNQSMRAQVLEAQIEENKMLAIVLVNCHVLRCLECDRTDSSRQESSSSVPCKQFSGHYVVICGYDPQTEVFVIKDPSSNRCKVD
ncbi:hypothetical protein NDN08_003556 [Rhodosorus marinus]|uniref:Guanylyl cyclase n=1 Tax=Rhodosorus marinus TaxID=101924 RepID=A0AAV8UYF8_9RHOD|nr:hypothetical protein NDN08_003556 [Rhodosorus marinus]